MPYSKLTIKTTGRKRGTVSLTIVRKAVAAAFANYDEQRKARSKAKRSRAAKAK